MLATPELISEAAQFQRLVERLPRFLSEAPLYRGVGGSAVAEPILTAEHLGRLPMITKQDLRRDFPRNFLGADAELETVLADETVELEHTSGTSEERTALLLPRGWWAEQELRALRLNSIVANVLGSNPEAHRITINSPVCSGDIRYTGVPSCDERTVGSARFVSLSRFPFLWSETDLARMAAETADWEPEFLDVDPVYGTVFALYCERQGLRFPSLKFILGSYEFVSVVHRRILERAFGVPVFDLYGSTETGHLLMEDDTGQLRPVYETAFLETLPSAEPGVGELVVTTFTNSLMPLIRYRIGDLVERCIGAYHTRYRLHGRVADAFTLPGGRRVTTRQIDQCFTGLPGIAHYQLIQGSSERAWRLRFVPEAMEPASADLEGLRQRLGELLGIGEGLSVQRTDLLAPESSGKFRLGYPSARAE